MRETIRAAPQAHGSPASVQLARADRLARLADRAAWRPARRDLAAGEPLSFEAADHVIENAIGVLGLPLGVGLNFRINGRDRLVPMAVEEPSVVAAASCAARLARDAGGFAADADPACMIGQIHLLGVPDLAARRGTARGRRAAAARRRGRRASRTWSRRGGGARAIELRELTATSVRPGPGGLHLVVDVGDAMGANIVNTMVEAIAPDVASLIGRRGAALHPLEPRRSAARAGVGAACPFDLLRHRRRSTAARSPGGSSRRGRWRRPIRIARRRTTRAS